MPDVVIPDASCLIVLDKVGEIDLLRRLYTNIFTTDEVAKEFGKSLPSWIGIRSPKNDKYVIVLTAIVDPGEASAIALSLECDDPLLIVDDLKARKLAERLGLTFTGTLGILVKS